MSFKVTPQHDVFFSWLQDPAPARRHGVLEAVAGSGKSSTLVFAAKLIAPTPVLYLAFNKSAVDDMLARGLPANVHAMTLNGLGYRALLAHVTRTTGFKPLLDSRKVALAVRTTVPFHLRALTADLVRKAKAWGLRPESPEGEWYTLADRFSIDASAEHFMHAKRVLDSGIQDLSVIDFDDQLYLPEVLNLDMHKRYARVFVDEAQDLSPIQRSLLRRVLARDGRLVAVGDRFQSIYGFRAADSDSIPAIVREFDAETFPLTVTYRCPKAVVALAQEVVPDIMAADTAPEGEVVDMDVDDVDPTEWRRDDLVICRNTAPLVALAYSLLRKRVPCYVAGRDLGAGLLTLIDDLKPRDMEDLGEKLGKWQEKECKRLKARDMEHLIENVVDRVDTLDVFMSQCLDLTELRQALTDLFGDDKPGTKLSTIHKAKGQEANRVFFFRPDLIPSAYAKQDWQRAQENNLKYVAVTRAKQTLVRLR